MKTQKILKTLMFINISFLLLNRRMKACLNLNVAKRQHAQNATVKCGRWDRRGGGGGGRWSSGSGNGGRYAVECGGYVCMMLSSEIHCRLRQGSEEKRKPQENGNIFKKIKNKRMNIRAKR